MLLLAGYVATYHGTENDCYLILVRRSFIPSPLLKPKVAS